MNRYPVGDPETFDGLEVDVDEHIAILTFLTHGETRTLLTEAVKDEVRGALGYLLEETNTRVLIITGSGDAFLPGADLADFEGRSPDDHKEVLAFPAIYEDVEQFPYPVIAALNGYTLGGGCELAMACDVRVAAASARLGQPEINLGIIPGGGGTQRLRRLVGEGLTMDLVLTGRHIDAETAAEYGLVDHCVPDDELMNEARWLAEQMAEKSPIALRYAKEAILASSRVGLDEGRRREIDLCSLMFATDDQSEGARAFFEDRDPSFSGE